MIYHILALERHDPLEKIDLDTNGTTIDRSNDCLVENSLFDEELRLTDNILEEVKLIMRNFLSTVRIVYWIVKSIRFSRIYIPNEYFYFRLSRNKCRRFMEKRSGRYMSL